MQDVYGISGVTAIPHPSAEDFDLHYNRTSTSRHTGAAAASIEVPVNVNAYGHCFPGSAYTAAAAAPSKKGKAGVGVKGVKVGWEGTVPQEYLLRGIHLSLESSVGLPIRLMTRISRSRYRVESTRAKQHRERKEAARAVARPTIAEALPGEAAEQQVSGWRVETDDERQARLIRNESVTTAMNCAALLSAVGQHYGAMSRLEEAWALLAYTDDAGPLNLHPILT